MNKYLYFLNWKQSKKDKYFLDILLTYLCICKISICLVLTYEYTVNDYPTLILKTVRLVNIFDDLLEKND